MGPPSGWVISPWHGDGGKTGGGEINSKWQKHKRETAEMSERKKWDSSEAEERCLAWLQVFMNKDGGQRWWRHPPPWPCPTGDGTLGKGIDWPQTPGGERTSVSRRKTGKGPFVRMGFSVQDHFSQHPLRNACHIKLAVSELVICSIWIETSEREPFEEMHSGKGAAWWMKQ